MATTDPLTGLTIQDQSDPAQGGFEIGRLLTGLAPYSIPRFATATLRDNAYTAAGVSLQDGMCCYVGGRFLERRSGVWTKIGGPVELLYENGNAGGSGVVAVGAGATGVLSVNVPASGVASDTAFVHLSVGVLSTGATTGAIGLIVNGLASAPQQFNISTTVTPIPVVMAMHVSIPAATFTIGVQLTSATGNGSSIAYSAIRATF